jgi:hypothetical protein
MNSLDCSVAKTRYIELPVDYQKLFPEISQRCCLSLFLLPVDEEAVDIVYNYDERLLNEENTYVLKQNARHYTLLF